MISTSSVGPRIFMSAVEATGSGTQVISGYEDHGDGIFSTSINTNHSKLLEDRQIQALGTETQSLFDRRDITIKAIILSFEGVNYLSSAALGKLITLQRRTEQRVAKLYLCGVSPDTMDVFQIAKMEDYHDFRRDLKSALEAAKAGDYKPGVNYKSV